YVRKPEWQGLRIALHGRLVTADCKLAGPYWKPGACHRVEPEHPGDHLLKRAEPLLSSSADKLARAFRIDSDLVCPDQSTGQTELRFPQRSGAAPSSHHAGRSAHAGEHFLKPAKLFHHLLHLRKSIQQ